MPWENICFKTNNNYPLEGMGNPMYMADDDCRRLGQSIYKYLSTYIDRDGNKKQTLEFLKSFTSITEKGKGNLENVILPVIDIEKFHISKYRKQIDNFISYRTRSKGIDPADVIKKLENWMYGVMNRTQLDYDSLCKQHGKFIHYPLILRGNVDYEITGKQVPNSSEEDVVLKYLSLVYLKIRGIIRSIINEKVQPPPPAPPHIVLANRLREITEYLDRRLKEMRIKSDVANNVKKNIFICLQQEIKTVTQKKIAGLEINVELNVLKHLYDGIKRIFTYEKINVYDQENKEKAEITLKQIADHYFENNKR